VHGSNLESYPAAGAAGPDATVRLLVDDEPVDSPLDHSGPLAGMKRQLRMLSQGSQDETAGQQQQATVVEVEPLVVQQVCSGQRKAG